MISVVHRSNFGFRDNFEGYLFVKDEKPFAQLHLYRKYNTFFWLGNASADMIAACLGSSVQEVSKQFGVPFRSLNSGNLRIITPKRSLNLTFTVQRDEEDLPTIAVSEQKVSFEQVSSSIPLISFIRFDVDSSRNLPLILWGDTSNEESSEIGFSSLTDLPPSVMHLLVSTCKTELTKEDLDEIGGQVSKWSPVLA
jgi:hypothetical protein